MELQLGMFILYYMFYMYASLDINIYDGFAIKKTTKQTVYNELKQLPTHNSRSNHRPHKDLTINPTRNSATDPTIQPS